MRQGQEEQLPHVPVPARQDSLEIGPLGDVVGDVDPDLAQLPRQRPDLLVQRLHVRHGAPLERGPGLGDEGADPHRELRQRRGVAPRLEDAVPRGLGQMDDPFDIVRRLGRLADHEVELHPRNA